MLALSLCLTAGASRADPPSDAARREAAQRFDRGVKLFNEQDPAGALAEFRRANELSPQVIVLYNIGLVYAAMGRPVDAVDALERALRSREALKPALRSRAETVLAEQSARIGRVRVSTRPEGARIEVDGVVAGRSPLAEPLRVPAGTHVLGAVLQDHAPTRKEVTVAGNQEISVELDLVATVGVSLGHLVLRSNVSDAVVRVDGQIVAKTPLVASLALASGRHSVEVLSAARRALSSCQLPRAARWLAFHRAFDAFTLDELDWNIVATAQRLNLARSYVYALIDLHGLKRHPRVAAS